MADQIRKVVTDPTDPTRRAVWFGRELAIYRDESGELERLTPLQHVGYDVDDMVYGPDGTLYVLLGDAGIVDAPPGFHTLNLARAGEAPFLEVFRSTAVAVVNAELALSPDADSIYVLVFPTYHEVVASDSLILYAVSTITDQARRTAFAKPAYLEEEIWSTAELDRAGDMPLLNWDNRTLEIGVAGRTIEYGQFIEPVKRVAVRERLYSLDLFEATSYVLDGDSIVVQAAFPRQVRSIHGEYQISQNGRIAVVGSPSDREQPDSLYVFRPGDTVAEAYPWYQAATHELTSFEEAEDGSVLLTYVASSEQGYYLGSSKVYGLEGIPVGSSFILSAPSLGELYAPKGFEAATLTLSDHRATGDAKHELSYTYTPGAGTARPTGMIIARPYYQGSLLGFSAETVTGASVMDDLVLYGRDPKVTVYAAAQHAEYWPLADAAAGLDSASSVVVPVQEVLRGQIQLAPNPTSARVHVWGAGLTLGSRRWTVRDQVGHVTPVRVDSQDEDSVDLDLQSLPAGIYILEGAGARDTVVKRVLIQ